ncbi:MAG: class I SAM-dependent methyltransferase [Xenococcaceae cyanobacterium]
MNLALDSTSLIHKAFDDFRVNPPDLREIGDREGEITYVRGMLSAYERTVSDIIQLFPEHNSLQGLNFIELGAFLGIVSKALSLASANVVACDIPEFFARENVKAFYRIMGIEIQAFNLRNYRLPFSSSSQDCVIACETLEHLNFNPLPIFAEINRILKPNGYFYIAMPNGSYLLKRIRYLITGNTPGFSVDELFAQLNPKDNMVVGLHWKEYTLPQTIQMICPLGFEVVKTKTLNDVGKRSLSKKLIKKLVPGGDTQVVVFKKVAEFEGNFSICVDS